MKSSRETLAAVLNEHGETPLKPVSLPELQPGDARVRLLASGVCSGEAMEWYVKKKKSAVLGHELVAEVLETKPPCRLNPGDRVFPHHHAPCGQCEFCRKNLESNCPDWKISHLVPGGYSEEFIVPAHNVQNDTLFLPPTLSVEAATFVEPYACCVRALKKAALQTDSRVLVVGLGIMGLLNVILFSEESSALLAATDFVPERRSKAMSLGAAAVFDPKNPDWLSALRNFWNGKLADVVVVCPPSAKALAQGISALSPGGRLVLFAPIPPEEKVLVDFNDLYFKEAILTSSYSAGPADCKESLERILKRPQTFESLVSHVWPLSRVGDALKAIREQDKNVLKIVVKPENRCQNPLP